MYNIKDSNFREGHQTIHLRFLDYLSDVIVLEKIDGGVVMCEDTIKKCQKETRLPFLVLIKQRIASENQYKNLHYIAVYWFITSLSFLYGFHDCGLKGRGWFMSINLIFIFGSIGAMFVIVAKYAKPPKHIRRSSWLVPSLILVIIVAWLYINGKEMNTSLRQYFIALAIVGNIGLFNFILYDEEITEKKADHMHRRYLEYLRNYVWVITFILIGYFTWQFENIQSQLAIKTEATVKNCIAAMSYPPHYPLCWSLLQFMVAILGGIILVAYAFHAKLREIEKAIK